MSETQTLPTLHGNGVNDDAEAVQALLRGEPVKTEDGRIISIGQDGTMFQLILRPGRYPNIRRALSHAALFLMALLATVGIWVLLRSLSGLPLWQCFVVALVACIGLQEAARPSIGGGR